MAVLLPHGAFLTEDRLTITLETAEPLGVSPPEAVDLFWIKWRPFFCPPSAQKDARQSVMSPFPSPESTNSSLWLWVVSPSPIPYPFSHAFLFYIVFELCSHLCSIDFWDEP